ncbi:PREDICTED: acidic leucine-rich nuclear phosphoprotein 32 family member B-like [Nicrophorus vespilloides]|uniref:Acidic leucine-rich nuclear phosphoprotein 32 family member B-like n=1 Tax=Nicrophorus vespilloides TaxID=110193 RepID=A0ABM1N1N5_NICVS|nr:PREDICTED: acidic leucine-rich nuclear phosphoprotein 32 family member B-like [Nicrophorus vespilloides]
MNSFNESPKYLAISSENYLLHEEDIHDMEINDEEVEEINNEEEIDVVNGVIEYYPPVYVDESSRDADDELSSESDMDYDEEDESASDSEMDEDDGDDDDDNNNLEDQDSMSTGNIWFEDEETCRKLFDSMRKRKRGFNNKICVLR